MKYIDLKYEERNLGVTAGKFVVEQHDQKEDCIHAIEACNQIYQEALIPTNNLEAVHIFEAYGFHFMENIIRLEADREQLVLPRIVQRFLRTCTYEKSTEDEIKTILDYIENAGAFTTDKIALNPNFGVDVAGRRYRHWMEDLMHRGGICYSIKNNGELYGFEFVTVEDGVVELELGSAFVEKGTGLAMVTLTASYNYWKQSDNKKMVTHVSSNNINILKLHEMFGLKVEDMSYVLSKYNK